MNKAQVTDRIEPAEVQQRTRQPIGGKPQEVKGQAREPIGQAGQRTSDLKTILRESGRH